MLVVPGMENYPGAVMVVLRGNMQDIVMEEVLEHFSLDKILTKFILPQVGLLLIRWESLKLQIEELIGII